MMSLFASFDLAMFSMSLLPYVGCTFCCLGVFSNMATHSTALAASKALNTSFNMSMICPPKMSLVLAVSVFYSVLMLNLYSLYPYLFPFTSQISTMAGVSLMLYTMLMMMSVTKNSKSMMAHMVPQGTPMNLAWAVFMIEMVSSAIRPITLSMRLVANIMAGHLLMVLLSKLVISATVFMPSHVILTLAEMGVALVQSFIMMMMLSIYMKDFY